jgi:hypothetical protein
VTEGLLVLALAAVFFLLRPEIWTRAFMVHVDPRPVGLMRVVFGAVVLWTLLSFAPNVRLFFSDEGLLLPGMAREASGSPLRQLWDPVHGFQHWWSPLEALLGASSILHLRSDPPLVFIVYGLVLVSAVLMTMGAFTTVSTAATWFLAEQLYRYDSMFANGGDLVIRAFLFLALFCRWGEAYSLDAWRRRRRELLGGATRIPPLEKIPAWPIRLMLIQLSLIYVLNGWHKTGPGWRDGTALYYALNLDHFYRVPAQGVVTWLQYLGVLPVLTWLTRAWEICFPLALVGVALRGYEADRRAGVWPAVAAPRRVASWLVLGGAGVAAISLAGKPLFGAIAIGGVLALAFLWLVVRVRFPALFRFVLDWLLGKRLWLGFGAALHLGIDLGMNIGTFPQVMMTTYLAWLTGRDIDRLWRSVLHRAPAVTVRYHPDHTSVRRIAQLRLREHAQRITFMADHRVDPGALDVERADRPGRRVGPEAALSLLPLFPALWWLRPFGGIPVVRVAAGRLALARLAPRDRQRLESTPTAES